MKKEPRIKVPRLVWQLGYVLFFLAASVPALITIQMFPANLEKTVIQDLSQGFVLFIYGFAACRGAIAAMKWLCGPLPPTRTQTLRQQE